MATVMWAECLGSHEISDKVPRKIHVSGGQQGESSPLLPCTARSSNAVDMGIDIPSNVEVYDCLDQRNIQTSCCGGKR